MTFESRAVTSASAQSDPSSVSARRNLELLATHRVRSHSDYEPSQDLRCFQNLLSTMAVKELNRPKSVGRSPTNLLAQWLSC